MSNSDGRKEALHGLTAFSVAVDSDDVDAESISGRVSQALRSHGITVLAPDAFPQIWVGVITTSTFVHTSTRGGFNVPVSVGGLREVGEETTMKTPTVLFVCL